LTSKHDGNIRPYNHDLAETSFEILEVALGNKDWMMMMKLRGNEFGEMRTAAL